MPLTAMENHSPVNEPAAKLHKPETEAGDAVAEQNEHQAHNESRLSVRFRKLVESAHAPTRGSAEAAGHDLHAAEKAVVPARGRAMISTGLQVELPLGYYGRVAPRSSLAAKHSIDVGAGVVDSDYRGELKVILFNFSDHDFEVNAGDRIAQLICERIAHVDFVEANEELQATDRGAGGFGSTGK